MAKTKILNLGRIINILKGHKEELKKKYEVKEIGVFGSYVTDEQRKRSDVDILVEFKKPIDFFFFLDLEEYLSELIGVKVDLVMKKSLKPHMGEYILQEAIYV